MPKKSYNQILDEHLHILIAQGNYEAFNKLSKRYQIHAAILVNDLVQQYGLNRVTTKELLTLCEEHFPFVVSKYASGLSSFYSFWKSVTSQYLMNYLIEHAFEVCATVSFDQKRNEQHSTCELIAEKGDERMLEKKILEIKAVINKYDVFFTNAEKTLLNLILEGYTLADFEHTGMLGKSQINLTYKSAVLKLQKYMKSAN